MKKGSIVFISVLMLITGCTNAVGGEEVIEKETLQWYVRVPFLDSQLGQYMKDKTEVEINELLEADKVGYQVELCYLVDLELPTEIELEDKGITSLLQLKESGTQVDVIQTNSGIYSEGMILYPFTYYSAVKEELLEPLDAYLDTEKGIELAKVLPKEWIDAGEINHLTYGVGGSFQYNFGTAYNLEYLEKYNIDYTQIDSDFYNNYEIFYEMASEHKEPIYQLRFSDIYSEYGRGTIGLGANYVLEDNVIIPQLKSEKFREEYTTALQWKKDGIATTEEVATPIIMNSFLTCEFEPYETIVDNNGVKERWYVVPNENESQEQVLGDYVTTSIASWSQRKEDAFDFICRLYGDERYANAARFGVEGVDYTIENDRIKTSSMESMMLGEFVNATLTYSSEEEPEDKLAWMNEYYEKNNMIYGLYLNPSTIQDEILKVYEVWGNTMYPQQFTADESSVILFGTDEWEHILDSSIEKMNEAGMIAVLEEVNRQYDEAMKENE